MKVTVIPIVIVVLGTATKRLIPGIKELEIRGRVKTMKSKAFIRSARISRKVLKTWGDLLSRRLKRKTTRSENSQMSKIIIIPARRPDLIIINNKKKKKNLQNCRLCCPGWPLKECEKKDKYLDLAREVKKRWNMQVTIMPIVISAFGTVTKGLLKGLEDLEIGGRVETIQTTALLRTIRILRRIMETWGDLLSLRLQYKTIG